MPGSRSAGPSRPVRLWTLSKDQLVLSTSIALWLVFPFGVLFSLVGIWLLFSALLTVFAFIGLAPPPLNWAAFIAQPFLERVLALVALVAMASGFLAFGAIILQCLCVTFDRTRGTVTVYRGWMGLHRQRRQLSAFQQVCVLPSTHFFSRMSGRENFDIVLTGENAQSLVVGVVTLSQELAQQVVREICEFTKLADGSNQKLSQS